MKIKIKNPWYHIIYWLIVIITLALVFGRSWGNNIAAVFFVSMLLPVVLGTSYFLITSWFQDTSLKKDIFGLHFIPFTPL